VIAVSFIFGLFFSSVVADIQHGRQQLSGEGGRLASPRMTQKFCCSPNHFKRCHTQYKTQW
jgi:hypothetical protein